MVLWLDVHIDNIFVTAIKILYSCFIPVLPRLEIGADFSVLLFFHFSSGWVLFCELQHVVGLFDFINDHVFSGKSLVNTMNMSGPIINPCGTPEVITDALDKTFSYCNPLFTVC